MTSTPRTLSLLAVAALAVTGCAQTTPTVAEAAVAGEGCYRSEVVTGSRIPVRTVCATSTARGSDAAKNALEDLKDGENTRESHQRIQ